MWLISNDATEDILRGDLLSCLFVKNKAKKVA